MKDIRTLTNQKNKRTSFKRGFMDYSRQGVYGVDHISWQSLGNDCAANGLSLDEAYELFETEWAYRILLKKQDSE